MRSILSLIACLLMALPVLGEDTSGSAPPFEMERFWMVFLERGDHPPALEPEALAALQQKHLAHLKKMWRDGYALISGPFEVPPEEPVRGISLYRGDLDREEVERLAGGDPMVQAGRLKVRVVGWWTGKGLMTFLSAADYDARSASSEPAAEAAPADGGG